MATKFNLLTVDVTTIMNQRPVLAATDRQKRRVLFRTGGAVRQTMKRSMRPARRRNTDVVIPRAGQPGSTGGSIPPKPPRYRTKALRDYIFFGVDVEQEFVSIGPTLQKQKNGITIPQLLNQGGTQIVTLPNAVPELPAPTVQAEYKPRPYASADSEPFQKGLEFIRVQLRKEELA